VRKRRAIVLVCLGLCIPRLFADTIEFTADTLSGFTGKKSEYTLLEGHAEVKTSKIQVTAERIELSGEDYRIVSAVGGVRGKNIKDDMDFECQRLQYDRESEIVILQQSAKIVDNPNEVTARAEVIEYNQQTGVATLQINIELRQKDSVCTGAHAIYWKDKQELELHGNPKIEKEDDVFRARDIWMNLDSEEIRLDGRVRGTVKDSKEEETPAPAPGESPGAADESESTGIVPLGLPPMGTTDSVVIPEAAGEAGGGAQ
jgi:lipopolysaccharide export system protein LptA